VKVYLVVRNQLTHYGREVMGVCYDQDEIELVRGVESKYEPPLEIIEIDASVVTLTTIPQKKAVTVVDSV